MAEIQRITTQYIEVEDRIRVAGEVKKGEVVVLWLTQRLLHRLVAPVCAWLEDQPAQVAPEESLRAPFKPALDAEERLRQSFAQQVARAQQPKQKPVAVDSASAEWLVHSVDIKRDDARMRLIFKGKDVEPVSLTIAREPMRQWLDILYQQCRAARWPLSWPEWMRDGDLMHLEIQHAVLH